MKLKTVTIRNFRHFTNLAVQSIPRTVRLIVLVGPNGCGKSSFLEALHTWYKWTSNKSRFWDPEYHAKAGTMTQERHHFQNDVKVDFHEAMPVQSKKVLYARSAYRNDPEFQAQGIMQLPNPLEEIRINRLIDNDAAVSKNYQRLIVETVRGALGKEDGSMTLDVFREKILGDIRTALARLFPELQVADLADPLVDGTFRISKGASTGYAYKNLSGGEKAAFDLILDFTLAVRTFNNTVFCIDEPEAHMNARLQSKLLAVLYDVMPEECQLVVATHSIGMMRQAQDIGKLDPGAVAFLDFANRCFDLPQIIEPTRPNRMFWERAYRVALDDLAELVAPERVVICEGEPVATGQISNHSHDARCYGRIFEDEFPGTQFVSMGNADEVMKDARGLAATLGLLVKGIEVVRLIDRDAHSPEAVEDLRNAGCRVLTRRNLEAYLFDDEVLRELAKSKDREDKAEDLIAAKRRVLQELAERKPETAPDDLKPASGGIYNACKQELGLANPGNNAKEFARDTLSRVVRQGMTVYSELRRDIFGQQK
ncbi:MAG: ATP-binding protein [Rhodothermaceae bacterium]|nr:ATP-binding protein [Rhodothermaceae bacterium]MYF62890.1 ATP-binding protein [Rhodothermaceae bacterium]MYI84545.1 ATP-binding protein [Rhodothermaceae bacterium]